MCRRFEVLGWDAVAGVVRVLNEVTPANVMPDWPARLMSPAADDAGDAWEAFPGSEVGVIVPDAEGALSAERLTWGFSVDWSPRPVYNARLEKAMGPNPGIWANPIARGRCIVPAHAFFEPHATETVRSPKTGRQIKRQYRFGGSDGAPLLLAAVRGTDCFSLVTTSPNTVVAPVHDRMPLALKPQEAVWWLRAAWPDFAARWQMLASRNPVALTAQPDRAQALSSTPVTFFEQGSLF